MLDNAMCFLSLLIVIAKLALKDGSSKHGKAIRAEVGSKSVVAIILWDMTYRKKSFQVKHEIKTDTDFVS